jgi:aminoglycoside phosphotransferase (APT) family kinase protein
MHERLIETVARLSGCAPAGLQVEPRTPLEHQSNRLYDAWSDERHLIVKEFVKPEEFATAPRNEHGALEILAPLDVAPRPVGLASEPDPGLGPIVVYEYLDGEMWDRQVPSAGQLAALAETWLLVHATPPDRVWQNERYVRPVAERYSEFRASFDAYRAWTESAYPLGMDGARLGLEVLERHRPLSEAVEQLRPRYCFCRSDARFANVIQRPDGRVGLVDWEDSGLRDPAREILDLLTHPNQEDLLAPDGWQPFLTLYLAAQTPLDPLLPRRVELYTAVYPLFWLSLFFKLGIGRARAGTLAGWTINGLEANPRLRRYLARALAWPDPDFSRELAALGDLRFFPT